MRYQDYSRPVTERCTAAQKNKYASRAEAESAAKHQQQGSPEKLFVYKCPYCSSWHLTRRAPAAD